MKVQAGLLVISCALLPIFPSTKWQPIEAGDPQTRHSGMRSGLGPDVKNGRGSAGTTAATSNTGFGQGEDDPPQTKLGTTEALYAEQGT